MIKRKGKLIIISGPSGVGKGTICKELLNKQKLNLVLSVSMTTRSKRPNEVEGQNYFFVSKEKFIQNIKNNQFLEYAKFVDNYYGTPKDNCEELLNKGKNVLLEIEIIGALEVMKKIKETVSIFILPPSLEVLKDRIINRKTEDNITINKRINKAKKEIKSRKHYNYNVINDNLSKTISDIEKILLKELD